MREHLRALVDPAPWREAERGHVRPLAEVAAALARLDERLGAEPGGAGLGRIAEEEAVLLVRADGGRLALETFLLWRHGAPGRGSEPGALARAGWAARRLAAPWEGHAPPADAAALRAFLGHGGREADPVLAPLLGRPTGAAWEAAAEDFLAALGALAGLHPLTRAAAALALWRAAGLGAEGEWLEGAVMAARLAAEGQGRARFLPLGAAPRIGRARSPGEAAMLRLGAFLAAASHRLGPLLAGLARRRDWAERAQAQAAALPGRLPGRVLALAAAESLVSANLVRDRLGVSQQAANEVLRRLAASGLVEELSGQRRYRLWRARL